MNSARPLWLALYPSRSFAALILLVYAAAAGCFLTVLTGWSAFALALLVLALGIAAAWDRALLRSSRSPKAIVILSSGEARCLFANGESAAIDTPGGSGVTRYWVAMRIRSPLRRSLLAASGMLPPESFRLLRLWALWGRLPGVAPRQLQA